MSKRVTVKITSSGYIPFINGNGPILKPISISKEEYQTLVVLGIQMEVIESNKKVVNEELVKSAKTEKEVELDKDLSDEESTGSEEVETEEVSDESVESEEVETETKGQYFLEDLEELDRDELRLILSEADVKYPPNMGIEKLAKLIVDSKIEKK